MINYKKKILTIDKLLKAIGRFPRKKNFKVYFFTIIIW